MRNDLGQLKGQRTRFCGRFKRYGVKPKLVLPPVRTFVLEDIQNAEGIILADHLWFQLNQRFASLGELQEGQMIEFDARVTEYEKQVFRGPLNRKKNSGNGGTDYRLSYPSNCRIVQG